MMDESGKRIAFFLRKDAPEVEIGETLPRADDFYSGASGPRHPADVHPGGGQRAPRRAATPPRRADDVVPGELSLDEVLQSDPIAVLRHERSRLQWEMLRHCPDGDNRLVSVTPIGEPPESISDPRAIPAMQGDMRAILERIGTEAGVRQIQHAHLAALAQFQGGPPGPTSHLAGQQLVRAPRRARSRDRDIDTSSDARHDFCRRNGVDDDARKELEALPRDVCARVLAEGDLRGANNPSAVLRARIRKMAGRGDAPPEKMTGLGPGPGMPNIGPSGKKELCMDFQRGICTRPDCRFEHMDLLAMDTPSIKRPSVLVGPIPDKSETKGANLPLILAKALGETLGVRVGPTLIVGQEARIDVPSYGIEEKAIKKEFFVCLGKKILIRKNDKIQVPERSFLAQRLDVLRKKVNAGYHLRRGRSASPGGPPQHSERGRRSRSRSDSRGKRRERYDDWYRRQGSPDRRGDDRRRGGSARRRSRTRSKSRTPSRDRRSRSPSPLAVAERAHSGTFSVKDKGCTVWLRESAQEEQNGRRIIRGLEYRVTAVGAGGKRLNLQPVAGGIVVKFASAERVTRTRP